MRGSRAIKRRDGTRSRIFISYRRAEAAGYAGRVYDGLHKYLPGHAVFMDRGMMAGADFVETIEAAIVASDAVIAIVHPNWAESRDDRTSTRRLDDPSDWVRRELSTAIECSKTILPTLVGGAERVPAESLPAALRIIAGLHFHTLDDARWEVDVAELAEMLAGVLSSEERRRREARRLEGSATRRAVHREGDRSWVWSGTLKCDHATAQQIVVRALGGMGGGRLLVSADTIVCLQDDPLVETTAECSPIGGSEVRVTIRLRRMGVTGRAARDPIRRGRRQLERVVRDLMTDASVPR